jgi:hypothetical protein
MGANLARNSTAGRGERWKRIALVLAGTIAGFLVSEVAVRTFGSDVGRWHIHNFVVDPQLSEGRWGLMQPDARLGHSPRPGSSGTAHVGHQLTTFDADGLRLNDNPESGSLPGPPLLVVGDSYAMGQEVANHQTLPAHLERLLGRKVLNGGVSGYGLDQVVLRAEALASSLRPEKLPGTLVVSFIADDVRRAEQRILWGIDKPYFSIERGGLVLRNVPVPPPTAATEPLDPLRQVLGHSFLVHTAMRRLGFTRWWLRGQVLHAEAAHDKGIEVACLLMDRLHAVGRDHGLRVLIVAQYTANAWWSELSTYGDETRVVERVLACARGRELETLDTRPGIEAAVRVDGFQRYYVGGHMNDAGNRLTAELVASRLRGPDVAPWPRR